MSIAVNFYPTKRNMIVGMMEATAGAGMALGPILGTGLFAIGGYNFTFYAYGSFFPLLVALFPYVLPLALDMHTDFE